jgi:putative hydroxymethylpyrimidine transport system permease protein
MLNANARMQIDLMFAVLLSIVIFTIMLYFTVDLTLKKLITWEN